MIITIIPDGLTVPQILNAQKAFFPIVEEIEEKLRLKQGQHVTWAISGVDTIPGASAAFDPKFELFLTGPCEIVSFESGESKATRIVASLKFSIICQNTVTYHLDYPHAETTVAVTAAELIDSVVTAFKLSAKK